MVCALLAALAALAGAARPAGTQAPAPPARPRELALVFGLGYAGDQLPQDAATFDAAMARVAEAGYNTVLASYEDWRLPILERHGLALMVDLLDERHHVYRNVAGAQALAASLRGDPRVWGYHLFSDTAATIVAGRQRDIDNVRAWDPTHPTFVGTQQHVKSNLHEMTSPDVVAYYDYHWTRDRATHFPNLDFFARYADERDAFLYRWVQVDPGRAGIGNPNRIRFTVTSSMAHGLKGVMWFLGTRLVDTASWEWNQLGLDVASVNHDVLPLEAVFAPLERIATYSTPATRNANDDPRGPDKPPIPPGLHPIPEGFPVAVESGEVLLGHFRDPADDTPAGRAGRVLFLANHNSYQPQALALRLGADVAGLEIFDRTVGDWRTLAADDGRVSLEIGPGYGELLRLAASAPTPAPPTARPAYLPALSPR